MLAHDEREIGTGSPGQGIRMRLGAGEREVKAIPIAYHKSTAFRDKGIPASPRQADGSRVADVSPKGI
jgi:hypothetical protein